ncbi:hypothetical protein TNCV_1579621 [Trichonephila clavipes]|nr:hypothetical protein TNCV_1579621 [Trichonephila clavipes]
MKNGWRLQGKLAAGTVVEFEAGARLFTDPISDKDGRKRKTIIEFGSNQEISPTKRGGRTYPETLYRSRAPAGGRPKAGRNAGRPKAANQRR